jgi:hypothetical protein
MKTAAYALSCLISTFLFSLFMTIPPRICEADAQAFDKRLFSDSSFELSWLGLYAPCMFVFLAVALFMAQRSPHVPAVVEEGVEALFIVAAIFYLFRWKTTKLAIRNGEMYFKEVRKEEVQRKLNEIKQVKLLPLQILLEFTDGTKIRLPLEFKENGKLLAMLRHYRPNN